MHVRVHRAAAVLGGLSVATLQAPLLMKRGGDAWEVIVGRPPTLRHACKRTEPFKPVDPYPPAAARSPGRGIAIGSTQVVVIISTTIPTHS